MNFLKKGILTNFVTPFFTSENLIKAHYKKFLLTKCTKRIHTPSDLVIFNYLRKKNAKRNRSFIYFIISGFLFIPFQNQAAGIGGIGHCSYMICPISNKTNSRKIICSKIIWQHLLFKKKKICNSTPLSTTLLAIYALQEVFNRNAVQNACNFFFTCSLDIQNKNHASLILTERMENSRAMINWDHKVVQKVFWYCVCQEVR